MANFAFDSSVTLVVKTPNQKVDDLRVDCALEWTVKQLKGHLSRVYPTKPASQHQRLIYSGQLLQDNLILKDVLREHEDGKSHTLHLVCPVKGDVTSSTDSSAMGGPNAPSSVISTTETTPPVSMTSQTTPDGLRYRGNTTPHHPHQFINYYQHMANAGHQFAMQGNGYQMPPFVPPPYWMQQMFAQQMVAGVIPQHLMYLPPNYGFPPMPHPWIPQAGNIPAPHQGIMTQPPQQIPQVAPQQIVNQAPQQQANENVQANANAGPLFDDDDDEENVNRDWLDKIYTLCRVAILLSIFWFYSSTGRFLLLITSLILMYLYQTGMLQFFRRNRNNLDDVLRQEIHLPPPETPQHVEEQQDAEVLNRSQGNAVDEVTDNNGNSDHNDDDETDSVPQLPATPAPPRGPSATTVAYNFLISFFTSLFPNGPPNA